MKTIKQWLKSWTINFGLLLQFVSAFQAYSEKYGDPLVTMIVGMIVIGLRFKTTKPVSEK